jgi:putative lipoic acid-binding regulatory protein
MKEPQPGNLSPDSPALSTRKPQVDYPCAWPYTVIGEDGDAIEAAIPELLAGEDAQVQRARASRTGRFTSFHVVVQVRDEEHRDAVFRGLQGVASVRIVI